MALPHRDAGIDRAADAQHRFPLHVRCTQRPVRPRDRHRGADAERKSLAVPVRRGIFGRDVAVGVGQCIERTCRQSHRPAGPAVLPVRHLDRPLHLDDPPDHARTGHFICGVAGRLRRVPAPQRNAAQAEPGMNTPGFWHLLPNASTNARPLDALWWTMVGLCALVAIGVFVVMFVFCIRYRKGRPADRHLSKETLPVELTWTAVPFLIFMGVFVWSLTLYARSRTPPPNAETIYVVAKQWMWKVQHPGGQREINTLHVPLGVPIRLMMTSQDVIHSFFVPAFRVKQDVLPDRYTQLWFTATQIGDYLLYCTQYCGLDHSKMGGQVVVMAPRAYARWLDQNNTG